MTQRVLRGLLLAIGAGATAYGVRLLLERGGADLRDALLWLAGGVVVHDGLVAPAVLLLAAFVARVLRGAVPAGLVVVAVVLGTVSVVAVPVLGRFGARDDNPTLLDRDYGAGWVVLAATTIGVALLVALAGRVSGRRRRRPPGS